MDIVTLLADSDEILKDKTAATAAFAFVALGLLFAISWRGMTIWKDTVTVREREQTRRELAAYVAEGSITAEDAKVIAGPAWSDAEEEIRSRLARGQLSPKKAAAAMQALREHEQLA